MTLAEIKEYKDATGGDIRLFGYTSTSLSKNSAEGFAWENQDTGHQKVLFHIKWNYDCEHYYLDGGAFDHEEEILLLDGVALRVEGVENIKDENDKQMYTLITLKN